MGLSRVARYYFSNHIPSLGYMRCGLDHSLEVTVNWILSLFAYCMKLKVLSTKRQTPTIDYETKEAHIWDWLNSHHSMFLWHVHCRYRKTICLLLRRKWLLFLFTLSAFTRPRYTTPQWWALPTVPCTRVVEDTTCIGPSAPSTSELSHIARISWINYVYDLFTRDVHVPFHLRLGTKFYVGKRWTKVFRYKQK